METIKFSETNTEEKVASRAFQRFASGFDGTYPFVVGCLKAGLPGQTMTAKDERGNIVKCRVTEVTLNDNTTVFVFTFTSKFKGVARAKQVVQYDHGKEEYQFDVVGC